MEGGTVPRFGGKQGPGGRLGADIWRKTRRTPAGLAPFIGEMLGVRTVPINYKVTGKRHSLSISKIVGLEVEDVIGPDGSNSAIQNAPFAEPLVYVAKSKRFTYDDYGMNWAISDKNSFHSPIAWKGP